MTLMPMSLARAGFLVRGVLTTVTVVLWVVEVDFFAFAFAFGVMARSGVILVFALLPIVSWTGNVDCPAFAFWIIARSRLIYVIRLLSSFSWVRDVDCLAFAFVSGTKPWSVIVTRAVAIVG